MAVKVTYPSQKDVQYLYSRYSTIENINVLYNILIKSLDASFLSTLKYENIHDAYNKILIKYYPNEICIKSNFINKILMKGSSHIAIFELPVGSSRTDLCKINGKSIAYEIKTDLDNFSRLRKQLDDYLEIFDEVYVICSEKKLKEIYNIIPSTCGIYAYTVTKRGACHFDIIKKSMQNLSINPHKQLQLLRPKECYDFFDMSAYSASTAQSDITKHIINNYDGIFINKTFKQILKKRYQKRWDFLKLNYKNIYEIDYQWFYKHQIRPEIIYK